MCHTLSEQSEPAKALRAGEARHRLVRTWRGVLLVTTIALIAYLLRNLPYLSAVSPLIIAVILGAIWRNTIGANAWAHDGIKFAMRPLLRLAIVLLGFQITLVQLSSIGTARLVLTIAIVAFTFVVTRWIGRRLGVDAKLAELIAAGTSICGASAILATNTVTKASDSDVTYAVSCITLFGTISMLLYPFAIHLLALGPESYGIWVGASVHEVGQVVAASSQGGQPAADAAVITKLARVLALGPLILLLGVFAKRKAATATLAGEAAPVPWFILGFCIAIVLASVIDIPQPLKASLSFSATFLLTIALAAIGLETRFSELLARGIRPLILAALSTIVIMLLSYGLLVH